MGRIWIALPPHTSVLGLQHPAAHGLFDLLLAALPHAVYPETGVELLYQVLVEAHHFI